MPIAIYWIARQEKSTGRSVTAVFVGLTAFGAYLSATAWAEYFEIWPLVFPSYIASATRKTAEFLGRARGPFLSPISNGIFLSICLGAALMLWPRLGRRGRMLMIPLYLLFSGAIYMTLTRSVWISGMLTLALVVGAAIPRKRRLPIFGLGLMLLILAATTQWDQLLSFKRDRYLSAEKTAESAQLRPVLATVAWQMFLDHPLFGCGFSQYAVAHVNYLADRSSGLDLEQVRNYIQHNVVLSLLTETGLVGVGLFLAIAALWGLDAWRLWSAQSLPLENRQMGLLMLVALTAYFTNGMFHDVSVSAMANMSLFFIAGVTASLRPLVQQPSAAVNISASINRAKLAARGV
jgi:O-antigen ligase